MMTSVVEVWLMSSSWKTEEGVCRCVQVAFGGCSVLVMEACGDLSPAREGAWGGA